MHFFTFQMTDDLKRICFEGGHRYILFSVTGHADEQGVPIYQAVCSGDNPPALGVAASWHYDNVGKGEGVRAYAVYETERVKEGMAFGNQELKAGDN